MMAIYDRTNVPDSVGRGTLDPELEAWLPSGPTMGADVPIAQGRRDHMQLGVGPWPSIGAVDTLVLPGPARIHHGPPPHSQLAGQLSLRRAGIHPRRRVHLRHPG